MTLLAFLTSVLFVQGISSPATMPRWALLWLVVPILWYRHPNRVTLGHLIGCCFLAWAAMSLTWTFNIYDGLRAVMTFWVLAMVFCAAPLSLRKVYAAMAGGLAINSAVVIAQVQGWDTLSQSAVPGGLFFNRNFGAELSAMVFVGVVASRLWWFIPGILPTLVLTECRSVYVALGVACILLIYQYNRLITVVLGVGVVITASVLWMLDTRNTVNQRIDVWLDSWDGARFWGRGLGSFYSTFPEHATRIDPLRYRPSTAHADIINLTYELGPGVLLLLGLLVYAWRTRPIRAEHYVLIVFLTEGLVGFPLYIPGTAFLTALCVGSLCRDRPELRCALDGVRVRVVRCTERWGRRRPNPDPSASSGDAVAV